MPHPLLAMIERHKVSKSKIAETLGISNARLSQMLHGKTEMPRNYEKLILELLLNILNEDWKNTIIKK